MEDEIPSTGGRFLRHGHVRNFEFLRVKENFFMVYRMQKLFSKTVQERIELRCFFVQKIREPTDTEIGVFGSTTTSCFTVDFYDPNFALAVGPERIHSIVVSADSNVSELWGFLTSVMYKEGIFEPSASDPNTAVVVGVTATSGRLSCGTSMVAMDSAIASSIFPEDDHPQRDVDSLLASLPLPSELEE